MFSKEEIERLVKEGETLDDSSLEEDGGAHDSPGGGLSERKRRGPIHSGETGGFESEKVQTVDPNLVYKRRIMSWKDFVEKKTEQIVQSKHRIGPVKPLKFMGEDEDDAFSYESEEDGNGSDSDSRDSTNKKYKEIDFQKEGIPLECEVNLNGHTKNVTSITIDHVGARMFTGGNDYKLHMWDLPNLDASLHSFRVLEPIESQPIKSLDFNNKGNVCLICGGNVRPKIVNREGRNEMEFVKGDMYIRDQKHTKGHTGPVTSGLWHPTQHELIVSSSLDGSVRVWDTTMNTIGVEQQLPSRDVLKCRDEKGLPSPVWKATVFPDGSKIVAAGEDGSYFVFSERNKYHMPELTYRSPYKHEVTSLLCYDDGYQFLSRVQDNTLRLFDVRRLDRPVHSWYEMNNNHSHTGMCFSPNREFIVTGSSNTKNEPGCLHFIRTNGYEEIARVPLIDNKVTAVNWNPKLNQLFVGVGVSIRAFYDPKMSNGGVMHCVGRGFKKITADDMHYERPIMTPHALAMFNNDEKHKRRNMETIRTEAKLSRKPEMPLTGPGRGGKVAGPTTITQHLMRTVHSIDYNRREDPVEAIKRFAEEAEANPVFVDNAYKLTQPKKILDWTTDEHEEKKLMKQFKKCPKCGLKMCHCYTPDF